MVVIKTPTSPRWPLSPQLWFSRTFSRSRGVNPLQCSRTGPGRARRRVADAETIPSSFQSEPLQQQNTRGLSPNDLSSANFTKAPHGIQKHPQFFDPSPSHLPQIPTNISNSTWEQPTSQHHISNTPPSGHTAWQPIWYENSVADASCIVISLGFFPCDSAIA